MEDIKKADNHFRIRKFLRIIATFSAVVFCCFFILDIWRYFLNDIEKFSLTYFLVMILCSAGIVHCAMSFSKTSYDIENDSLIVKDFLKKDKKILFLEFVSIEEAQAGPFTYIKLVLKDYKAYNIPPLDNQTEFIKIIKAKL